MGNLTEVLIPFVNYHMRVAAEERDEYESVPNGRVQRTQAEQGRHLEQYDRKNNTRAPANARACVVFYVLQRLSGEGMELQPREACVLNRYVFAMVEYPLRFLSCL